jgi:uncharacterized membrane protein
MAASSTRQTAARRRPLRRRIQAIRKAARRDPSRVLSARRALTAAALGALAGGLVALVGPTELAPIAGWIVAAVVGLAWVWTTIWPQDHVGTKRLAEQEGRSHSTDTAVLVACIVSLAAVVVALVRVRSAQDVATTAAVILSVVAVVLSWCLMNTVFALKYARLYYVDEDGGIDFKQEQPPSYSDFAFVAFGMGMSYSPPETEFDNTHIRRVALGHTLLSYVMGTAILAVAVNLVANLAQG